MIRDGERMGSKRRVSLAGYMPSGVLVKTGYVVLHPGSHLESPTTMTTENLRREARVDVSVPVVVYRGKKAVALHTSDVSFKGLFVRTDDPPALLSLVRLKVALFDREFEAHAMAVHVVRDPDEGRAPGVGLQFWGLSGPNRSAWDDFVRGLVQARRAAAAKPLDNTSTSSGIRIVAAAPVASSKS